MRRRAARALSRPAAAPGAASPARPPARARRARAARRRGAHRPRRSRPCCAANGCGRRSVATARREVTQPQARALHERHPAAAGVRWWSTFESQWLNVTLFDRAASALRLASCARSTSTTRRSSRRRTSSATRRLSRRAAGSTAARAGSRCARRGRVAARHLERGADACRSGRSRAAGPRRHRARPRRDGAEPLERGPARLPVAERQQRVDGAARAVLLDRARVRGDRALRGGEQPGRARSGRAEEGVVRLLRRPREGAPEAVDEDRDAAVLDRERVAPESEREPEPEIGREQRVRPLARQERRRAGDPDHERVERLVERRRSAARSRAAAPRRARPTAGRPARPPRSASPAASGGRGAATESGTAENASRSGERAIRSAASGSYG